MSVFEKESQTFQGKKYRDHLNRNWEAGDGMNESLNKQIRQMYQNPPTGTADEVTQARISNTGYEHSTLKAHIDSIESDAEYARSAVDKKADADYIDEYLSKMTAKLITLASVSDLEAKYPSGAEGLFVTADTGHKYIWDGSSWKDCGQYQAAGIIDTYRDVQNISVKYGYYISGIDGVLNQYTNDTLGATDYFVVVPGSSITIKNFNNETYDVRGYALYQDKTEASRVAQGKYVSDADLSIAIPNDANYCRLTIAKKHQDDFKIEYDDYVTTIKRVSKLSDKSYTFKNNTNVLGQLTPGAYIDGDTGTQKPYVNNNILATDYIAVKPHTTMQIRNAYTQVHDDKRGYALYDFRKNYILGNLYSKTPLSNGEFELTNNSGQLEYLRLSVDSNSQDKALVYAIPNDSANKKATQIKLEAPSFSTFQKFAIIGDSYASGELVWGENDANQVDHYELSWGQILARKSGNTCINMSNGGQTTRGWLTNEKYGLSLLQSSEIQDLYVIALGINDAYALGDSYLGTINDVDSGADTFYGNYAKIIDAIISKAPKTKIIISTMANNSDIYARFNKAIINLAGHYDLPYIEQYNDGLFTSEYYMHIAMSGGHPTAMLYGAMADAMERLITQCVRNNYDYFADYGR